MINNMSSFRDAREAFVQAYASNLLDDEEFCLLYDLNTSKNPEFEYWQYAAFNFDDVTDADALAEFRFHKGDILRLSNTMAMPDEIICYLYNDLCVDKVEALCVLLRPLAYPCRYSDMISRFGRPVPQLCMIFNQMIDFVYSHWGHLLGDWEKPWLNSRSLQSYADAIHRKGAALNNVWGFVDGTIRPCSRPQTDQRVLYNGHKKVHGIKFQSVTTPSGLIANLYGPIEG